MELLIGIGLGIAFGIYFPKAFNMIKEKVLSMGKKDCDHKHKE